VRAIISGELRELRSTFSLEAQGELERWTIRLVPKARELAQYLRGIELSGGKHLEAIGIEETSGERLSIRMRNFAVAAELEARVFTATDRIFAVSDVLGEALVARGVARAKIEVAPNGVDPSKFPPRSAPHAERFTIGFAGSLKPWHGVEVLLRAFAAAVDEERSLRLEVIGAGPATSVVERASFRRGAFAYLGQQTHDATLAAMSRWNVGVAPFLPLPDFYFSPLKVVEYMASGLCPVVSDLGQLRTLVGGGERGVLVPAGDAEALADAIVRLSRDRDHAAMLGGRARAYVLANHTWRQNARRVLAAAVTATTERAA
jgi:glycosyltransferase involved in cell wall biosynthesis